MSLHERLTFLRHARTDPQTTGAVQPSSRYLARAMAEPLRLAARSRPLTGYRILEMGPGTGSVTLSIAHSMGPADRLDCYEINHELAAYLEHRIAHDPRFQSVRGQVRLHARPAEEAVSDQPLDFIVCSLPLNNLDPETVERLLATGFEMLHRRGTLTYFEYPLIPWLIGLFTSAGERRRIEAVQRAKCHLSSDRSSRSSMVFFNIPPARVCHVSPSGQSTWARLT